ncbi:flagellar assembly protein H [Clostridium acetireducens DSM 10703]|jgi:flagellar assembly protein FliH|uniref:Flagellar assembly protein H n=1 Tax=Clostridium acetireducens DSM 10703 TaxID=1121290 RepID=A0A1E8F087_9CLOT|nr:FliH/SctL family protein [Clostridium acetireducens]OFI06806.1 flagellar assembly protein H [Clostridium acetireducens DSM 10703]
MQSSYNIIKFSKVSKQGEEKIETKYSCKKNTEEKENKKVICEEKPPNYVENYKNVAKVILEDARNKKEDIINKAYEESEEIFKQAYEKAYKEGQQEGYEKAYEEAYVKNLEKANIEIEEMKNQIKEKEENIIKSAKEYYKSYLEEKELEIKNLVINISESILKREVNYKESLNEMIFEALNTVKNTKMFIIKCNPMYEESLKNSVDEFKSQLAFKGDIFILSDENLQKGEAIIERDNGKIKINVEEALNKVKEILFNEE